MRVVSDAEELSLGRRVRLVSLNPGVSPASPLAEAVRGEALRLAAFDHPALPKVLRFVDGEGELWFTLSPRGERSFGRDVRLPVPAEVALEIARELADVLEHVHERGCVHGELELASLSLTDQAQLVVDGLGRSGVDSSFEPVDRARPVAHAPEVTLGEPLEPSVDVFCLGAILYELLSGRAPFGDPHSLEYPKRLRHEQPPRLGAFGVSDEVERFCFRCLAKTREERPRSASEARRHLETLTSASAPGRLRAFLRGEAEETAPPPPRVRRTPKSSLVLAALAGVFALGALGLLLRATSRSAAEPDRGRPLASLPTSPTGDALLLRVVATPWAHVYVDGAHLETTPFAAPLRLTPGKHEVELRHPNAAPERRTIDGTAGQAILLDVAMHTSALSVTSPKSAPPADSTP